MTTTLPPPVADPQTAGREPKRVPYVPALDGLRALAVIAADGSGKREIPPSIRTALGAPAPLLPR